MKKYLSAVAILFTLCGSVVLAAVESDDIIIEDEPKLTFLKAAPAASNEAPLGSSEFSFKATYNNTEYTLLYINFDASFNISYNKTNDGSVNVSYASVDFPATNTQDLSCSTDLTSECTHLAMSCSWTPLNTSETWTFEMGIEVTKNDGDKDLCDPADQDDWEIEYEVTSMSLTYVIDTFYFPDAENPGETVEAEEIGLTLFETDGESSYKCDSSEEYSIGDKVEVEFKDFQMQAFQFSSGTDSAEFDTAKTCSADDDGSSLVPIVVGCVLAGLIIITLIAYFIGRWHQNKQGAYQAL